MIPQSAGYSDALVVVNGPEDGAEFPIVRTPMVVGEDPGCDVCIRLDRTVEERHALISVVSEGYRVRRMGRMPVFVNGKKAGALRSRIVHSGGTIQIGHTLMTVECVPDGLAARSRGVVSESDLGWAFRQSGHVAGSFFQGFFDFIFRFVGRLTSSWLLIIGVLIVALALFPTFRGYFGYYVRYILFWISQLVERLTA